MPILRVPILRVPLITILTALLSSAATQAPDVPALTVFERAEAMRAEGRYARAESLYQEALAIQERRSGLNRPGSIRVMEALADLYHSQGRESEAEGLCRRVLEVRERTLNPLDPLIATSLNNLAEIYRSTYRYVSAEPLYRRALAIIEATLGPAHPLLARALNNLASLRVATRHYDEAGVLFQRALAISEKGGGESSQVSGILYNLAICAMDRGKYRDAEPYLLRSLRIEEAASGENGPTLLSVLETYALVLRKTRRASLARQVDVRLALLQQSRPQQ